MKPVTWKSLTEFNRHLKVILKREVLYSHYYHTSLRGIIKSSWKGKYWTVMTNQEGKLLLCRLEGLVGHKISSTWTGVLFKLRWYCSPFCHSHTADHKLWVKAASMPLISSVKFSKLQHFLCLTPVIFRLRHLYLHSLPYSAIVVIKLESVSKICISYVVY